MVGKELLTNKAEVKRPVDLSEYRSKGAIKEISKRRRYQKHPDLNSFHASKGEKKGIRNTVLNIGEKASWVTLPIGIGVGLAGNPAGFAFAAVDGAQIILFRRMRNRKKSAHMTEYREARFQKKAA